MCIPLDLQEMEKLRVHFGAPRVDKATVCVSHQCRSGSRSQLGPSAGAGGEFGLQVLVATVPSQRGEGEGQLGK